jgi:dCMP deaminase
MSSPIRHSQADWDLFFYRMAEQSAMMSKDPNRKVGAVIASASRRQVSFGYNGFPSSIEDTPENLADDEFRLAHTIHAEDNCLRQLPFDPIGGSLYVTRFPCEHCADKIISSGIKRVIAPCFDPRHHRWGTSWAKAVFRMNREGIIVIFWEELI